MARSVRALLLACPVVLAGCGNAPPSSNDPPATQNDPPPSLADSIAEDTFRKCAEFGFDRDYVQSLAIDMMADRQAGYSASEELDFYGGICYEQYVCQNNSACEIDCDNCIHQIVFVVYAY